MVLDDFPYLVASEPALPSIIQRWWDHAGRTSRLLLVLCGSAQAVMEDLQGWRAPLFGRVDLRLQLRPFDYAEAALLSPRLPAAERALVYGIFGGMPPYLRRWDAGVDHRTNLARLFGDPTSPLGEEGEFVLSSELAEASGYFRILQGIASGHRTYGRIKDFAGIEIQHQLERLVSLGLVERTVPVTEEPDRSRRVLYRIADNFMSFWFRFIFPRRWMCRGWGRWWSRDTSVAIDVVGMRGKEVVLAGSVKWARSCGAQELRALARAAQSLPGRADEMQLALFARDQVDDLGAVPSPSPQTTCIGMSPCIRDQGRRPRDETERPPMSRRQAVIVISAVRTGST